MAKRIQELKDGLVSKFDISLEELADHLALSGFVIADRDLVRNGMMLLKNIDKLLPDDSGDAM